MKYTVAIVLLISFNLQSFGQEIHINEGQQKEVQTLFGNKKGFGGYLGMNLKMTEVNGQEALLTGGELCFVLNRSFNIGFEGYGMVNEVRSNNLDYNSDRFFLQMGYGGLHLEPVIASEGLIHVTIPILLGAGGVAETSRPYWEEYNGEVIIDFDPYYHESDYFFVAEPGVNLELNVFKFMRLTAGASYRFTSDFDLGVVNRDDINGWNANMGLRFGWF